MKATLEYDLIEDAGQFKIACTAMDWALTVFDIDNEMRRIIKYGHKFKTVEQVVEHIRGRLFDIMQEKNIDLDMIE